MNRSRLLLTMLGLFFSFISLSAQEVWDGSVAQSFAGGTGTQDDPYLISCAEELAYLSKLTKETPTKTSGTYYKLIGNIILNEEVLTDSYQLKGTPKNIWTPIGESENTTGHYDTTKSFMGYFDGGGHVVSGVYCPTSYQMKGLFGTITGEVHDLNVIDSYVSTGRISGAVVGGVARSAKLYRCYAEALTEGSEFGGLVVGHVEGLVEHCYSTGRVQSNTNGGGIAGWLNYGTARNCFSVFYGGNGTIGGSGNNGTQSNMYYDRTVDGSKSNGIAKTTDEMQNNDFIELLGSPFEAMDGEYPFIPGLLLVGEGVSYSSTAFRLNIGKLTNGIGTKIRFYREYDGTNLRSAISRSEIGETVYVKLNIRRRMLLTEGSLVLTNDTTGQSIPLTAIADNIWSFTMPESTVTLTAAFHVDPNVPKVWDGTVSETFAGGSGTQEDPYLIASGEDLALLAQITNENKGKTKGVYYKQTADIYLNESLLNENFELIVTPENMWTPIADCSYSGRFAFQGDYDGNGHVISGLYYVTEVSQHYAGLFGIIGDDASIHDLAVVDAYVSCRYSGGLLVGGVSNNASVRRCYASGLTEGSGGYMGLLTGGIDQNSKVIIEHCYASGINNSASSRGGLLGTTASGTIRNCFTVARVNHDSGRRGAIVGYVQNTYAQFSYLFYDKTVETTLKALEDENTTTCYGLTTEVMQSDKLAELLGEPFEFADGNYPYILGLPRVGEYTAYVPAGHHLTVGTLTNSKGSSVGFYETYENSNAKKRINYAEAGQTVYLKVNLYRNMQIAEGTLVVTNDVTGKSVAVTNVSDGIWSFTMPESTVTVSASFIRDTSLPAIWDGTVANAFAEGDGSEDDPYLIHDGEELAYLAQLCNANSTLTKGKYFQLANDIILNEDVLSNDFEVNDPVVPYNLWTPIGKDQSHSFQGYFNGNNHFISGAYVDGGAVTGLFGYVNGGSIRNLSFIDSYIVGTYPAMVSNLAVSDSSWVSNCYVEACSKGTSNSTSYYTSHIVSVLGAKGTIENCYASGLATGYGTKAAIVGNQTGAAVVRNCFSNVKGATSIGGVKNYNTMDNIYNDLDLGVTMGNAKDTYCSKLTVELQSTDFAAQLGSPFEYVLGNYPYIPGLQKIGENRGWTTPKDPTHGGAGEIWDGEASIIFANGTGTEADPYIINNGSQLYYLALLTNANGKLTKDKYYKLDADIILNENVLSNDFEVNDPVVPYNLWTPIGKDQSHSFQGYFNGNNHFISGAYVDGGAVTGLFGYVNGGSIRNLSFIDSYIVGTYPAMVSNLAVSDSSWVSNCYVEACSKGTSNSTSYYTSHIVSVLGAKGTIENCYASGLATGYGTKAAIVGNQTGAAVVRNCFSNVKGATSIGGVKNYNTMDNIYNDLDLGVTMGNAKDTYCSKLTVELQSTDFAAQLGSPFEYVLGNYPYIPGLQKIGENRGWTTPKDPTHGGAGEIWDGEASIIFASGTGTEADPYIINNGAQLKYLAKLTNANGKLTKGRYYRLEADIVLNDTVLTEDYELRGEPANIWEPIGAEKNSSFQGVLDGNNYIISGLYINNTSSYQALFGYIDGTIRDLQITDSYVKCYNYPAGLVSMLAQNDSSLISHCFVDAHVECAASGGYYSNYYASALVNTLGAKGIIEYCYTNGLLTNAGNLAGLVCTQTNGGVIRNSYTVAKGGRAVNKVGSNIYISNVYYSRERAGESQASQVKEDFRSAEDVEMLSTDFAAMLGEPYEYSLGYYPYIYGLPKINEKGKTVILNGYPLNLGTIINGSDCHLEFYRTYAKKTKELSHEVIPGSKVMVDGTIALYAKVTSSAAKRLSDEGLVVVTDAGETVSVTEIADNVYEFTMTKSALSVSAKFVLGGYCGNPEENNGRNMRWQLSDDKSTLIIAGTGNMYSKPWTTYANNINAIEVNEGVTSVMDEAFKGMNKVTTATLAATLETIGTEAFCGCSATVDLSTCTLLTALHANEFSGFAGTVYLPESVTTIEIDAFAGTYASVQHVYSPVADGKTLFANDVQVPDVEGMGDIVRYGITDNQEVRLVWSTGYLVTAIANSDGKLKVYADEALNKEIPAGYKAIRTDDQTRIYLKVEPKNTKILFLDGLTVKAGSSTLAARQESDEVFSFLMPKSAVTISAQFATGGYCGNTNVNNGHNLIWTLYGSELAFQKNSFAQGEDMTMGNNAPWSTLGSSIEAVDLNNVTSIGNNAFTSCTNLVGLELPATPVITVGDNAFAGHMVLIIPAESWDSYQDAGWAAYAEQTAKDKETLTLADGLQWRTYYSKVGRMLPEGLKVYTVTNIGYDEVVMSTPLNYVPAGQAVLIENSEKTASTAEAVTSLETCLLTTDEDNLLQWITEPTTVSAGQGYTLYKDEFVMVSSGTLPANIAFLPAQGSSASRLGISITETTGIEATESTPSENGDLFNLKGQRVDRPSVKGVYLRNGKKVIIK